MYKVFGFINIALVVLATSPYWVRKLNQWFFHRKGPGFTKLMKVLRVAHKPLAVALLASIVVHGWLAVGAVRLNTGTLAGSLFIITAVFGLLFYLMHKLPLLKWHRALALVAVLAMAVHLWVVLF